MILQILIAYVLVAEVIFFYWIISSAGFDCGLANSAHEVSTLSLFQKFRVCTVFGLLMLVAAPFALPVMVVALIKMYRQDVKEHEEKYGHHVEMSLEPLHPSNIPTDLEAYIEEHQPAATAMNFDALGDYWLKGEPYNSKARLFISDDRACFAEIGVTLEILYCEVISFLADGSMVGTGNCQPVKDAHSLEKNGWYLNTIGEADMLQTIEAHSKFLEDVVRRSGQAAQKISQENWKEYYQYHNHKYGQVRFERGEIKTAPASCQIPWEQQNEAELQTNLV